jgi:glycosyltransferase involved in cell wall biosynthesis
VDFELVFAAADPEGRTHRLVREQGVQEHTRFLGGYALEDLPAILGRADAYASCSLKDGTSSSLLEAMSTGLFPVVSDIEANRPWVEDGRTGRFFPCGDDEALADRLQEALANPAMRREAARPCREVVVQRGRMSDQMDRLLEAIRERMALG